MATTIAPQSEDSAVAVQSNDENEDQRCRERSELALVAAPASKHKTLIRCALLGHVRFSAEFVPRIALSELPELRSVNRAFHFLTALSRHPTIRAIIGVLVPPRARRTILAR